MPTSQPLNALSSRIKKLIYSLFAIIYSIQLFGFDYKIEGTIYLPDGWSNSIYLSAINSFDERNTASEDFIINTATIDSAGRFSFTGKNLPDSDRLYRLHVCKTGDPLSTIIIGGNEENHIHFIMNNNSQITAYPDSMLLFHNYRFNNEANVILNEMSEQIRFWKTHQKTNGLRSREFNQAELEIYLKTFVDTCHWSLLQLIALNELDIEANYDINKELYYKVKHKLAGQDSGSPYYKAFDQQLAFIDFKTKSTSTSSAYWWLILPVAFVLFGVIRLVMSPGSKRKLNNKLLALSLQERKIFDLLVDGLSNKEISSHLHIELSTVKSHVYNIYSKLDIKSRKEVVKFKPDSSS
jgi:DNA-binding CsgD family transcriptional regulator